MDVIESPETAHCMDVTARNGIPFRVMADFTDKGLVEVYDLRHKGDSRFCGPYGQFTGARAYVTTVLGEDAHCSGSGAWVLDAGIGDWVIDVVSMNVIRAWLQLNRNRVKGAE
ncbi:hypothetical protein [Streptomyces sp. 5-10]|uniref:hypothetical protein n=1 Tax=Streptomyces sp. 5-10 TaxID=878925 RepID=UPI00168AFCF8|nr:hypothetical protein [Streptomyces sp. 5-10]MBD3004610.1 hypothetical protein [Streptomyces sp. 5-10]